MEDDTSLPGSHPRLALIVMLTAIAVSVFFPGSPLGFGLALLAVALLK